MCMRRSLEVSHMLPDFCIASQIQLPVFFSPPSLSLCGKLDNSELHLRSRLRRAGGRSHSSGVCQAQADYTRMSTEAKQCLFLSRVSGNGQGGERRLPAEGDTGPFIVSSGGYGGALIGRMDLLNKCATVSAL